jgi:hypothetical protein
VVIFAIFPERALYLLRSVWLINCRYHLRGAPLAAYLWPYGEGGISKYISRNILYALTIFNVGVRYFNKK